MDLILSLEEMIILLNELYSNSKVEFNIEDCLYELPIAQIHISEKVSVKNIIDLNRIKDFYNKVPQDLKEEFPDSYNFFEVFIKAGFFFEIYYAEIFKNILKEIETSNFLEGDLPIALAFDTNLYYNQFFSSMTGILEKKYGNPRFPVRFLLSEGVKKELTGYERKYKLKDLENLKNYCKNHYVVEEFFNQNKLFSRLWHLGHIDYLKCNDMVYSKIVDIDTNLDLDEMDSKIIEGFINEIKQQNVKLYLFSQDSDFITRAKGNRNVKPIFIDKIHPNKLKQTLECSWEQLARLLYVFSITFGAVKLIFPDQTTIYIFGIWKGKKYNHWESEMVKVRSKSDNLGNVKKDLNILENVNYKTN